MFIFTFTGIVGSSGCLWKEQRTFALSTLRNFGFGKRSLECNISEEVHICLESLEETNGEVINPLHLIQACISNILCSVVFGQRFELNDERFLKLLYILDRNFRQFKPIVNLLPSLRYIPGDPAQVNNILNNCKEAYAFFQEQIDNHKDYQDGDDHHDYIGAYLHAKSKIPPETESTYTGSYVLNVKGAWK